MKKLFLLGAAVLAFQALPAIAAEDAKPVAPVAGKEDGMKKPHREGMFEKQDTNKDGVITEAEALAHSKQRFAEMDANKDGKITKEEAKAHHDAMKSKWKEKRGEMKGRHDGDKPHDAPAAN